MHKYMQVPTTNTDRYKVPTYGKYAKTLRKRGRKRRFFDGARRSKRDCFYLGVHDSYDCSYATTVYKWKRLLLYYLLLDTTIDLYVLYHTDISIFCNNKNITIGYINITYLVLYCRIKLRIKMKRKRRIKIIYLHS